MKNLQQLSEVARTIVSRVAKKTHDIEVRIVRSDGYGYEVRNRELAPELSLGRVSVGLRALTENGLAVSATSTLDIEQNVSAILAALPAASATPLTRFGEATFSPDATGHDAGWETWAREPARLRDLAADLRDRTFAAEGCGNGGKLSSVDGGVSFGTSWSALATREGEATFKRSSGGAYIRIDSGHYQVRHLERAPEGEVLEKLRALGAETLAQIPERVVTPADLKAGGGESLPVILHPSLLETMIRHAASEKFLGASRNAGLTDLASGQAVWDPAITLMDSGVEPGLSSTRPCDDELTATRATPLIENGLVGSLVWSRRSSLEAKEAKEAEAAGEVASTGNGYRSPMMVEEPSEAPVRDKLSGLILSPGQTPLKELIANLERGIYLQACLGIHGADKARAAFSTTVYDGFAIEDGEIVAMLAPGTWNVAGHLFPEGDEAGFLAGITLSRERENSGSGLFPWMLTALNVG